MTTENPDTRPTWTDPARTAPVTTTIPSPTEPAAAVTPSGPPAAAVAVPVRRASSPWLNVMLGLAAVIAVGGVAFAIGRATAPSTAGVVQTLGDDGAVLFPGGSFDPGAGPTTQQGGPGGLVGLGGGPKVDGTVTAMDADSLTITLDSGETMTIALDNGTTYHTATDATAADIAVGDEASVGLEGFGRGPGVDGDDEPSSPTASDVTVSR